MGEQNEPNKNEMLKNTNDLLHHHDQLYLERTL